MGKDKRQQALKLQEEGRLDEAEKAFKRLLQLNRNDFVVLYSLGVIRFKKNNFKNALTYFKKAQTIHPAFAPLFYNIGLCWQRLGDSDKACENFKKSLALDNTYEPAQKQLDLVSTDSSAVAAPAVTYRDTLIKALELQSLRQLDEAEQIFKVLIERNPNDFIVLYSLGAIEQERGRPDKALEYIDRGLAAKPDYAKMWYSRGVVMQALRQNDKAVADYDRALQLDPGCIEALINRGAVLVALKRHKEALLTYEELIRVDPDNDKALCNRGIILTDFKMYDHAIQTFTRLLEISPEYDYAPGLLAFAKMHACDWNGLKKLHDQIVTGLASGKRICKSQALLAISGDPSLHLLCARIFSQQHCPPQEPLWRGEIYHHTKIKVAYLSPDFREHPVGHLTAGLFEAHDKEAFEVIAFSLGVDDESGLRRRMLAAFDAFIDVRQTASRDVAQMMRDMEIDIVVDLAGYTADSRTDILAYRPAPVQVNYLGYSSTMGVDYIDYIIADSEIIPEAYRSCYQEKVVYLPDCYLPTDAAVQIAETTPPRGVYGLPADGFVFCSFNHDYKINPPVFDIWMRLLKQVPGSVLWLMKLNECAERNLLKEATSRGVETDRIIFATRVPRIEDHLARYRMADLFLDTTPYNAHTTTSDVLRAGLPVITCREKSFAGRVAASLLTAVGLPELITDTLEDYEQLALRLATDELMLAGIRQKLQVQLRTTSLYDTVRYCRNLETAYTRMWQLYQQGKAPEHFSIAGSKE